MSRLARPALALAPALLLWAAAAPGRDGGTGAGFSAGGLAAAHGPLMVSVFLGTLIVTFLYVTTNLMYLHALPLQTREQLGHILTTQPRDKFYLKGQAANRKDRTDAPCRRGSHAAGLRLRDDIVAGIVPFQITNTLVEIVKFYLDENDADFIIKNFSGKKTLSAAEIRA